MSDAAASDEKSRFRARSRDSRRARSSADADGALRRALGADMGRRVTQELDRRGLLGPASTVAVYVSTAIEPDTSYLRSVLRSVGVRVLIPRVAGTSLEWCVDDDTDLAISAWGIPEPTGEPIGAGPEPLADVSAIVLPALAIDINGHRVGQGGGFYDRALGAIDGHSGPVLIGIVFDDEVLAAAPHEPHDARVDVIITEMRTIAVASAQ